MQPNLSDAKLVIIVVMKLSRLSTSSFVADWIISQMSLSKSCQAPLLFAGGHLIFLRESLPRVRGTEFWRDWALWYDSCPCTSSVLPGLAPARCSRLPPSRHFIRLWCIFKTLWFFPVLPQMHLLKVCWAFQFASVKSILLGISSAAAPPLRIPWGYCAFRFVIASFLVAPHRAGNLGS